MKGRGRQARSSSNPNPEGGSGRGMDDSEAIEQGRWDIEFYSLPGGRKPVEEWIRKMKPHERGLAFQTIDQLQELGLDAKRPLVRQLKGGLYELRWKVGKGGKVENRIAYFARTGRTFVMVHGFSKKTQTTPKSDLDKALSRMKDYKDRSK